MLRNIEFPDDIKHVMLLVRYREQLEQAFSGALGLLPLLEEPESDEWASASASDFLTVANWASMLLELLDQHDPLKAVLSAGDDFLGVYEYEVRGNPADERTAYVMRYACS